MSFLQGLEGTARVVLHDTQGKPTNYRLAVRACSRPAESPLSNFTEHALLFSRYTLALHPV